MDIVSESLTPSRYVLTNNVGIAGGLSWELKRSDIILFDKQGELKYGLSGRTRSTSLSIKPILLTG